MPNWTIHSDLDPKWGLQICLVEISDSPRPLDCALVELSVRETLLGAIDGIEQRYFQGDAEPMMGTTADASRRLRMALWKTRSSQQQAFLFHRRLRPAKILGAALCLQADALSLQDWTDATFAHVTALIADLVRRPLRFFRGTSPAVLRQLDTAGYNVTLLRP